MNIHTKLSILSFALFTGGGFLLQSCTGPTFDLKPAARGAAAPCGLGLAYVGEIRLSAGQSGATGDTTANRPNVVATACEGAGEHPDAVYKLVVEEHLKLFMEICSTGFDCPSVALWTDCPTGSSPWQVHCNDGCAFLPGLCLNPGTYWLAVEAHPACAPPNAGAFTIEYSAGEYDIDCLL